MNKKLIVLSSVAPTALVFTSPAYAASATLQRSKPSSKALFKFLSLSPVLSPLASLSGAALVT